MGKANMNNMKLAMNATVADLEPLFKAFFQAGMETGVALVTQVEDPSEETKQALADSAFDMVMKITEVTLAESASEIILPDY